MSEFQVSPAILALMSLWASAMPVLDRARWLRRVRRELRVGSAILHTARGPVEVGVLGEGPPLLVLHGGPGGYDLGLRMGKDFAEGGLRVIAPSRPGYLRTPLEAGPHPEQAADTMVAMLDVLGLESVGVFAAQHGGPTALALALRHPDRVAALVLESCFSQSDQPMQPRGLWGVVTSPDRLGLREKATLYGLELLARLRPRALARLVAKSTGRLGDLQLAELADQLRRHPEQTRRVQSLPSTVALPPIRQPGLRNDLAQLKSLPDWPLHELRAPTLVTHGALDELVGLRHGEHAANSIPQAELVLQDSAGHYLWMGAHAPGLRARELAFFWTHLGDQKVRSYPEPNTLPPP